MKEADIKKYIAYCESKASKAFDNYQYSGTDSALKTQNRWEDLEDICRLALKQIDGVDGERERRYKTITDICKNIEDKTYSREEVIDLIWKAY